MDPGSQFFGTSTCEPSAPCRGAAGGAAFAPDLFEGSGSLWQPQPSGAGRAIRMRTPISTAFAPIATAFAISAPRLMPRQPAPRAAVRRARPREARARSDSRYRAASRHDSMTTPSLLVHRARHRLREDALHPIVPGQHLRIHVRSSRPGQKSGDFRGRRARASGRAGNHDVRVEHDVLAVGG
jgi:hypothetical protein